MSTIEIDMVAADAEAVRVLTDGPMAWLAELDLLHVQTPEKHWFWQPGDLVYLRSYMKETEWDEETWYEQGQYALCFPHQNAPNTWALAYWAPSTSDGKWRPRLVTAEVDRW